MKGGGKLHAGPGAKGKFEAPLFKCYKEFKMVNTGHYAKLSTLLSWASFVTAQVARTPTDQLFSLSLSTRGVQHFVISGPHWRKKSCLGPHIKYTNTNKNKKKSHNVLSKFTVLCWAAFIAILGHTQPAGCRLDTPVGLDTSVISYPLPGAL